MSRKCIGTRSDGTPCKNWAIKGATVCRSHGGGAPQVRAKAAIRVEVVDGWGLGDTTVDPGELLLRLLSQSSRRAERYAAQVAELVEEHGLVEALTGESFVMNDSGNLQKVGEYVKALAQLENAERDRCAKYAGMAIQAGLAERTVRLAERQGALIEQVLSSVFAELGLSDEQRAQAPGVIRRALQAVS